MSCPVCQSPSHKDFAPFCSRFCKNRDLLKWLKEEYRIPIQEQAGEDTLPVTDGEEEDDSKK